MAQSARRRGRFPDQGSASFDDANEPPLRNRRKGTMNRFFTAITITVACVFATTTRAAAPPTTRPNVLFIICDDLTTTAIGCYGNKVCKTPNIDRLATMGVRFEHAYCNWPLCLPSRNSFMAGRRPDARYSASGLLRERVPDVEFLPEHFRKNGYFTARVGKLFHTRTVFNGMKTLEDPACWDVSEIGGTDIDPCGYSVLFSSIPKGLEAHPELQKITVEHELL